MEAGFIKLWRQMLFNECLDGNNDRKALWVTILLKAKHKTETYNGTTMQPGEFIISYGKLARTINVTKSALRSHLKHLNKHSMITHQTSRKGTKITVLNWDRYQSRAQSEHDLHTIVEPTSSTQPAQKLATIKEEKKKRRKEEKKLINRQTKKTAPVCDFFQCNELNEWMGTLPERTKKRWENYADYELMEEMTYGAKEWTEVNNKTMKSYSQFVENWWKRDKRFAIMEDNRRKAEFFAKYDK